MATIEEVQAAVEAEFNSFVNDVVLPGQENYKNTHGSFGQVLQTTPVPAQGMLLAVVNESPTNLGESPSDQAANGFQVLNLDDKVTPEAIPFAFSVNTEYASNGRGLFVEGVYTYDGVEHSIVFRYFNTGDVGAVKLYVDGKVEDATVLFDTSKL